MRQNCRVSESGPGGIVVQPTRSRRAVRRAIQANGGRMMKYCTMSTTPPMQGGLQPMARTKAFGKVRESIDPDDFTGGFAVWSGTSFAAPIQAGRIAQKMVASMPLTGQTESAMQAVDRAWKAVEKATDIKPH